MDEKLNVTQKIIAITGLSAEYCLVLENCRNMEREEFIDKMLYYLPSLYLAFSPRLETQENDDLDPESEYFESYVDEDYYDSIRRKVETILGPDDTFLETFEVDMKYSDTPIAASISECLADIFQPLFNFVSIVRDSDGEKAENAYRECKDNFIAYWSQTLCNVLRALNNLKYTER